MTHTNDTTADPFATFIGAGIILSVIACILTLITAVITAPETTASLGDSLFHLESYTPPTIYTAENAALGIAKLILWLTVALATYQVLRLCYSIFYTKPLPSHWSEFALLILLIISLLTYHDLITILANAHFGPLAEITKTFSDTITVTLILSVTTLACYFVREILNTTFRKAEEK